MKINLAKSAGFCFGVKRALKIALDTAGTGKKVFMLGDIVHNEEVVREITASGIRKIEALGRGRNNILLIRAHGCGIKTIKKADSLGYQIIDATCPMVKEIHRIAQDMEKKGYRIIIIGDKLHDEVLGIAGHLEGKPVLIESSEDILPKKFKKIKKACVVVQSTQDSQNALRLVNILKKYIGRLRFFNTICVPTRSKQEEIKKMPLENDVMIVIGSKKSANTKRLYQISKSLNKNSYWVTCEKEIKKNWLKHARSLGISAGASTPDATTAKVIAYIRKLAG